MMLIDWLEFVGMLCLIAYLLVLAGVALSLGVSVVLDAWDRRRRGLPRQAERRAVLERQNVIRLRRRPRRPWERRRA